MKKEIKKQVYFAGAIRGDRIEAENIISFIHYIQELGHKVLTEHIADKKISDKKMKAEDIEKRDIAWLDCANHVIAEISGASTGTGREIEYARVKHYFGNKKARILCLYESKREFSASPMIRGMTPERYENVIIRKYKSIKEAKEIIKKFLES